MSDYKKKIDEIYKKKNKIKYETNNYILNLVKKKIIYYIELQKYECQYIIPSFILGFPRYIINDVAKYIIRKIQKGGIDNIIFIEPNILYIEWSKLI